jgi:hypothetical protein
MSNRGGRREGAGRKKGTLNKKSQSIKDMIDAKGCNPVEAMANCLQEAIKAKDTSQIIYIADKLAPYYAPKLASSKVVAEVTGLTYEEKLALLDKQPI